MTSTLDLSSALALRVANSAVSALRIANVDVWPDNELDTSHLFAAWACDEGSGSSILDYSGNSRNLSVVGTNLWPTGHDGYAHAFEASNSSGGAQWDGGAAIAALSGDSTYMGWTQHLTSPTDLTQAFGLYSATGTARCALYTYRSLSGISAAPQVTYRDSGSISHSIGVTVTTADNNWHHSCVVCHSSGVVDLYQDGVLLISVTEPGPIGTLGRYIGMGGVIAGTYTGRCAVNDLRVFDAALTITDIAAWMDVPVHV